MSTALHKSIAAALRKGAGGDGTPSAEQVALINGYTLRDFKAEELYVREFVVAHNAIDRDGEVIDEALLDVFVKTLPGKGMFIKHPTGWDGDSGPGEATWFAARAETMSLESARALLREPALVLPYDRTEVKVFYGAMYTARHESNAQLISKIDAGIANFVSIGFSAAGRADVINPMTKSREAVRLLGPGEAFEASLVWLGAQPGARAIKTVKELAMTPEQLAALKAALGPHAVLIDTPASLKAVLDLGEQHKAAGATLAILKSALGTEHAALLDSPAELVAAVIAGKAYTNGLIDDLLTLDRLAKRCGDTDEAVATHRKMYAAMPAPALKHLHAVLSPAGTAGAPASLAPSDPNATKPAPGEAGKAHAPDALNF